MNIILVSGATARVRSLTLDWRHWTLRALALAVVIVAFTGVFNFVTLRYADPFTDMQSFHEGIDFPADSGTAVVAAASGKVIESGYQPQYGKIVVIDHGNGLASRYAHASELRSPG